MGRPRVLLLSTRDVGDAFAGWECVTAWKPGDPPVDVIVLDLADAPPGCLQTAQEQGGADSLLLAVGPEEQIPLGFHPDAICPPTVDAVSLERRCRQLLRLRATEQAQMGHLALRENLQKAIERSPSAEGLVSLLHQFQLDVARAARQREETLREVLQEEQRLREQLSEELEDRKRGEEALWESEERYRLHFESARDVIFSLDPGFRFLSVSPSVERFLGYRPEELVGRRLDEAGILVPESLEQAFADTVRAFRGEPQQDAEYEFIAKDGSRHWGATRSTAVYRDGEVVQLNGIARDTTKRRRAEEGLKRVMAELERSNAELEQFAYVASHDLQEPLRMVSGYVGLLAKRYEDKLDTDAQEFIAYAVDGTTRMQTLIQDLLAYSRLGTQGQPFQPTDCTGVLEGALANLQVAIEESGAVITHDPLPSVSGDESQLVQLLQNLIGNALKFRGEDPPRVHVSAQQKGQEWVFAVRDNGIGIAPESSERIFQIFQRLHGRDEYPGTGIGLAVCKKIVERHGGRIWVESEPGKGATFYFTIPVGQDDQP